MAKAPTSNSDIHGRTMSYAKPAAGPVLLLVHGMAGTSENWGR